METNIQNRDDRQTTRYESVLGSLAELAETIRKGSAQREEGLPDTFEIFAYCFGLRFGKGVADIGGLWRAAEKIDVETEVAVRRRRYEAQAQSQKQSYGSLASMASQFGLGGLVSSFVEAATESVRNEILQEVVALVMDEAGRIGDVAFAPPDLEGSWRHGIGQDRLR